MAETKTQFLNDTKSHDFLEVQATSTAGHKIDTLTKKEATAENPILKVPVSSDETSCDIQKLLPEDQLQVESLADFSITQDSVDNKSIRGQSVFTEHREDSFGDQRERPNEQTDHGHPTDNVIKQGSSEASDLNLNHEGENVQDNLRSSSSSSLELSIEFFQTDDGGEVIITNPTSKHKDLQQSQVKECDPVLADHKFPYNAENMECVKQPEEHGIKSLNSQDFHTQRDKQNDIPAPCSSHSQATSECYNTAPSTNPNPTGYLDEVISTIQSLSGNETSDKKDSITISRAELTLMVEHTLAAQTMCNYVQNLVQENHSLSSENAALKKTVVQINQSQSLQERGSESRVFRFDRIPLQPSSVPITLGPTSNSSGYSSTDQNKSSFSLPQADGDCSPQPASQVAADGDPPRGSLDEAAVGTPPLPLVLTGGYGEEGASMSGRMNIPKLESLNMHLGLSLREEDVIGSAGPSQAQHDLQFDELVKVKLFVRKICKDYGIHPDNMSEMINLREKVQKLQQENTTLKTEIEENLYRKQGFVTGDLQVKQLQNKVQDLTAKLQQQKDREDHLLALMTKIGTENKRLKAEIRPQSQPPSSVGLQALAVVSSQASAQCQTDRSWKEELQARAELERLLRKAQAELTRKDQWLHEHDTYTNSQLAKAEKTATEYYNAHQKLLGELNSRRERDTKLHQELGAVQQKLEAKETHHKELAEQFTQINEANEKLKRQLSMEAERNRVLEGIIKDERTRYDRDEKQLLDRVKLLTEKNQDLKKLILVVEAARKEGGATLSEDVVERVAGLKKQEGDSSRSSRPASPRTNITGVAGSGRASPQQSRTSPQDGGSQGGGAQSSASGGKGSGPLSRDPNGAGSASTHGSLAFPSLSTGASGHQRPHKQTVSQASGHKNSPRQNIGQVSAHQSTPRPSVGHTPGNPITQRQVSGQQIASRQSVGQVSGHQNTSRQNRAGIRNNGTSAAAPVSPAVPSSSLNKQRHQ